VLNGGWGLAAGRRGVVENGTARYQGAPFTELLRYDVQDEAGNTGYAFQGLCSSGCGSLRKVERSQHALNH
jgi:hypothetical protein